MTQEEWDKIWKDVFHYFRDGNDQKAWDKAHEFMNKTYGPRPSKPKEEKAGLPLWVRITAPLVGVSTEMLTKIWDWLNGKKTVIGAVITAISVTATQLGVLLPLFGVDAVLVAKIIGIATTVVGLLHKAYKFIYKEEHP